jgi:hypothetical protein
MDQFGAVAGVFGAEVRRLHNRRKVNILILLSPEDAAGMAQFCN